MPAQISAFTPKPAGSRIVIKVTNAETPEQATAVPNSLVGLGFVAITDGPNVTSKAGGYGSLTVAETNRTLERLNVIVATVQSGVMTSRVSILVQDYEPSLGDALLDGLTFGPARRAGRSGIDAARRAHETATQGADDLLAALRAAGESVGDSIAMAGALYVVAQVAIAVVLVLALVWFFRSGNAAKLLGAGG